MFKKFTFIAIFFAAPSFAMAQTAPDHTVPVLNSEIESLANKILDAQISMRQAAPLIQELQKIAQAAEAREKAKEKDTK